MIARSKSETIHFKHPFSIDKGVRTLPAGAYELVIEEELIEGLSFPSYRRVAMAIMVPSEPPHPRSMEMISISSLELADALRDDATATFTTK